MDIRLHCYTFIMIIASKPPDISYTICGKKVCQNVWIATLGISSSFFYCIRKKFLNGSVAIIKEPSRSPSQKNAEGNSMDTKLCRLTWRPPATQNDCSFAQYLNESWHISQNGGWFSTAKASDTVSQSNFFKVWDEHFSHVAIPKVPIKICIMIT